MADRWWESRTGVSTALANVTRPIEEWASGLPNEAYVSDTFAEWEQDVLLASWRNLPYFRHIEIVSPLAI